jgi:hypothetical protein
MAAGSSLERPRIWRDPVVEAAESSRVRSHITNKPKPTLVQHSQTTRTPSISRTTVTLSVRSFAVLFEALNRTFLTLVDIMTSQNRGNEDERVQPSECGGVQHEQVFPRNHSSPLTLVRSLLPAVGSEYGFSDSNIAGFGSVAEEPANAGNHYPPSSTVSMHLTNTSQSRHNFSDLEHS